MTSRHAAATLSAMLVIAGCGGSSSSSSSMPPVSSGSVRVRFAEGAPDLEAIINGVPQSISPAYLQVNGKTVASSFNYGNITNFVTVSAGAASLVALDVLGYRVGPIETGALSAGKYYSVVLVGAYPHYRALTFEEPPNATTAQLSFYEASPAQPRADFGTFEATEHRGYKQRGSARLGQVVTVSLGDRVTNIGGYVGNGVKPFSGGTVLPKQIDQFDRRNALPFHNASRLCLYLFDVKSGSPGPVYGALDR